MQANNKIEEKLKEFVKNQKDLNPEFADILNEHISELYIKPKKDRFE